MLYYGGELIIKIINLLGLNLQRTWKCAHSKGYMLHHQAVESFAEMVTHNYRRNINLINNTGQL